VRKGAKEQIIYISLLLTSAIASAALLAGYMIYRYGPSGRYVAGHTILSPYVLDKINYKDHNPKTGSQGHYIFDSIQFSYFDKVKGEQRQLSIDPTDYQKFYILVEAVKSLENTPADIQREFNQGFLASLNLTMRTDNSAAAAQVSKIFQVIQFTDKDYFRVHLHSEENTGEWAYFYQPHIYQDVIKLFTKT
jgi:hypothetical protein